MELMKRDDDTQAHTETHTHTPSNAVANHWKLHLPAVKVLKTHTAFPKTRIDINGRNVACCDLNLSDLEASIGNLYFIVVVVLAHFFSLPKNQAYLLLQITYQVNNNLISSI